MQTLNRVNLFVLIQIPPIYMEVNMESSSASLETIDDSIISKKQKFEQSIESSPSPSTLLAFNLNPDPDILFSDISTHSPHTLNKTLIQDKESDSPYLNTLDTNSQDSNLLSSINTLLPIQIDRSNQTLSDCISHQEFKIQNSIFINLKLDSPIDNVKGYGDNDMSVKEYDPLSINPQRKASSTIIQHGSLHRSLDSTITHSRKPSISSCFVKSGTHQKLMMNDTKSSSLIDEDSPKCTTHSLSFWNYVLSEINYSPECDDGAQLKSERVANFLAIPFELEKVFHFHST